jgi:hypothetical protein
LLVLSREVGGTLVRFHLVVKKFVSQCVGENC